MESTNLSILWRVLDSTIWPRETLSRPREWQTESEKYFGKIHNWIKKQFPESRSFNQKLGDSNGKQSQWKSVRSSLNVLSQVIFISPMDQSNVKYFKLKKRGLWKVWRKILPTSFGRGRRRIPQRKSPYGLELESDNIRGEHEG